MKARGRFNYFDFKGISARKNILLAISSAIAIILDWYPLTIFLSLPFCLIWVYCAWLRSEPQLKWVNIIFLLIYGVGITRYFAEK